MNSECDEMSEIFSDYSEHLNALNGCGGEGRENDHVINFLSHSLRSDKEESEGVNVGCH